MRCPQYGHNKGKRRGSQTAIPPQPKLFRAVGLAGPNQPMPTRRIKYLEPNQVTFLDGGKGAKTSLHLWRSDSSHAAALAVTKPLYSGKKYPKRRKRPAILKGVGDIISKQPTAVKNTHRVRG